MAKGLPRSLAKAKPTATKPGAVRQMPYQAPAAAGDVAALKAQLDALLSKLVASGMMAPAA